jgi:hypothetical protein
MKAHLDDECLVGRLLEVERLEHHKQALYRVKQNRFVVFPGAAGDESECGFRVVILVEGRGPDDEHDVAHAQQNKRFIIDHCNLQQSVTLLLPRIANRRCHLL